jgi:hypothetical protein
MASREDQFNKSIDDLHSKWYRDAIQSIQVQTNMSEETIKSIQLLHSEWHRDAIQSIQAQKNMSEETIQLLRSVRCRVTVRRGIQAQNTQKCLIL